MFVIQTPYSGASEVVCYTDTWVEHIAASRKINPDTEEIVKATLSEPNSVCEGTTNRNYVAFINLPYSSNSGAPFVVFVDPNASPLPTLVTFGHRRDFKDLSKHTTLWTPSE
jgi:hypothetical protein